MFIGDNICHFLVRAAILLMVFQILILQLSARGGQSLHHGVAGTFLHPG